MVRKLLTVVLLATGLSLILTACGGSGGDTATSSIQVTITDFAFAPNTFTVPAGAQVSYTAVNNGVVEHSFLIMKKGHQVQGHFTDAAKANVIWREGPIEPRQTVTGTFTAPGDPGEYQIVCGVPGHFEAGMVAKLIIVEP